MLPFCKLLAVLEEVAKKPGPNVKLQFFAFARKVNEVVTLELDHVPNDGCRRKIIGLMRQNETSESAPGIILNLVKICRT